MARCGDCNKFVGVDADAEPEVNDIDVSDDGVVSAEVRIVNACSECGTEMHEYTFNNDNEDVAEAVREHREKCHDEGESGDLSVEEDDSERVERTEGRGRGMKRFYGYHLNFTVTCNCGKTTDADSAVVDGEFSVSGELGDDIQASYMDEC